MLVFSHNIAMVLAALCAWSIITTVTDYLYNWLLLKLNLKMSGQDWSLVSNYNTYIFWKNKMLLWKWQITISCCHSFSCTSDTWSWEWWYIQRMAADVRVGFCEPYTVSSAFRTLSIAWKWLSFQYLTEAGRRSQLCVILASNWITWLTTT